MLCGIGCKLVVIYEINVSGPIHYFVYLHEMWPTVKENWPSLSFFSISSFASPCSMTLHWSGLCILTGKYNNTYLVKIRSQTSLPFLMSIHCNGERKFMKHSNPKTRKFDNKNRHFSKNVKNVEVQVYISV